MFDGSVSSSVAVFVICCFNNPSSAGRVILSILLPLEALPAVLKRYGSAGVGLLTAPALREPRALDLAQYNRPLRERLPSLVRPNGQAAQPGACADGCTEQQTRRRRHWAASRRPRPAPASA